MLRARPGLHKALRLNTIGKSLAGYKLLAVMILQSSKSVKLLLVTNLTIFPKASRTPKIKGKPPWGTFPVKRIKV